MGVSGGQVRWVCQGGQVRWVCQVGVSCYRSLEELQKRNEELLAVVRELSSQNEKMEVEMGNERYCTVHTLVWSGDRHPW